MTNEEAKAAPPNVLQAFGQCVADIKQGFNS